MKEPQVQKNGYYWNEPDKEWLEDQYIIQNKSAKDISEEVNVNSHLIGRWLEKFNIPKKGPGKVKQATSIVIDGITMRPPTSIKNGNRTHWAPPDKAWLEYQYETLRKSASKIGREVGVAGKTLNKWFDKLGVVTNRSKRQLGANNGNWKGGTGHGTLKRECQREGRPCVCVWCGEEGELKPGYHETSTPICSLELHHKDHNTDNCDLDNLLFLCHKCHMLETWMWQIRKAKKANVSVSNKIITIDFNV